MLYKSIIFFTKKESSYPITSTETELDLSKITDFTQFVFEFDNFLDELFSEDGYYKWIGDIDDEYHLYTKAFLKL